MTAPVRRRALRALGGLPLLATRVGTGRAAAAASSLAAAVPAGATTAAGAWPAPLRPVPPPPGAEPFSFALIGDLPYANADEPVLAAMLADTDADRLAFVLHVGDIKGGREPCSDALYLRRRALFERSAHPLVLLPGDNEWTDCHRRAAGGHDPRERLAALRRIMWSRPGPLGGPAPGRPSLALERQPDFPENVRWRVGPVHFVAVHVVGASNGLDDYPGSRAEFAARERANLAWLAAALDAAIAARADAFVICAHADPGFGWTPKPGFAAFVDALQEVATRFANPIAFLHGDSHRFRADRPLPDRDGRTVPHFMRVESFGHPMTAQWVRITYDPDAPMRFHVTVRDVPRPNGG